ncbi:TetR/AcrR family transcriptional regulator [Skermania sp. ID1734]|uniref:TetR/AcrR family transcriptional regulator n=1 Tax=Skermania sp. ID1734 TaxID=2597516 RepID=UPI002106CADF|nr:TetR/AcrR family transcriptional regulator [Skermania sp. ID1734]
MTRPPSPRRRLEPDKRREQILSCAIRMFGERPYAAVSTTDLAREAGVARGLINHYFGTKRDLYLAVVRQMTTIPPRSLTIPDGSVRERAAHSVRWLLDVIERHGKTWVAVMGAEGVGDDPEVQAILDDADTAAAEHVLDLLGTPAPRPAALAAVRAYGGMVKAAGREWIRRGSLTREQAEQLLNDTLLAIIEQTFPALDGSNAAVM